MLIQIKDMFKERNKHLIGRIFEVKKEVLSKDNHMCYMIYDDKFNCLLVAKINAIILDDNVLLLKRGA